jgi:hypothetical protein
MVIAFSATRASLVALVLVQITGHTALQHIDVRAESWIPKLDVVGSNPIAHLKSL